MRKMNWSWPIHLIVASCCLCLPAEPSSAIPEATAEPPAENFPVYVWDNSGVPIGILDLMENSQAKYLAGVDLLQAGDSDKAREAFNEAVNLLLQSNWDLTSTPVLSQFFQELIQRIQDEESRYLLVRQETKDATESTVADNQNTDLIPITIDPALKGDLTSYLTETRYEIPITINKRVMKSLDYWLNHERKYFEDGLVRSGQYRPLIEKVFREESIPLDLMYLAQVESFFKPHALSKAKAKGIWQFEKETALRYGLKITRDVDERSDPEKSTRAAARYLNDLFAMFKDWNLALAAYNWGEDRVQRVIDRTGLKDFWQLVDMKKKLPRETKNHIPLIQASVILGRNPEKYGLPTELDPPLQYAKVSVSKPIDLRAAARVLSTSTEELKKLNPALRGFTTPANYPDFQLKVPADSDPSAHVQLASLPRAQFKPLPQHGNRYRVRPGDTLSGIAVRYHVSIAKLQKANNLDSKNKLRAGISLQIP